MSWAATVRLAAALSLGQAAPSPAPAGRTWTLAQVVDLAEHAHPDVREAELRAKQARADVTTAELRPNPQAQLGITNVPTYKPQSAPYADVIVWSLGVSEDFELGGKRGKRKASADEGVAASDAAVLDTRRNTRADVEGGFYKALAAQEHERIARDMLARYLETVRLTRARAAAGDLSGVDLDKVELETFRYEDEVRTQTLAAAEARGDLFKMLGLSASPADDRVDGTFPKPTPPELDAAQAIAKRADLVALDAQRRKAEADLDLARAQAVPNLNLGLSYDYAHSEAPSGATSALGVTASVPLPIFDRNQGEIAKAELEVEHAKVALERARADALREAGLARHHLEEATATVDKLESTYLAKAERARDVAERTYLEGHTSLLEVLEAQRTYLETRYTYLDAQLERALGAIELARALGSNPPKENAP